jgi:SAM-dependent methyltransferase
MQPGAADTVPARVRWAVDTLALRAGERVLDLGSGTGASVELVMSALGGADAASAPRPAVVAIDRSAVAVGRIRARVGPDIDRGVVDVRESRIADLDPELGPFDAAFCVNVNVFWTTDAAPELAALARVLPAGARLLVAYGPGPVPRADAGHLDGVEAAIDATPWFAVRRRLESEQGSAVLAARTAASADQAHRGRSGSIRTARPSS